MGGNGTLPVKEASRAAWLGWSGGESPRRLPSARQHRTAVTHEATPTCVVDRHATDASFVSQQHLSYESIVSVDVRNNNVM